MDYSKLNGYMIELTETDGRLTIHLRAQRIGADWSVAIFGGDTPHIGAIALACPDGSCQVICLPNHREAEIAKHSALSLATSFGANISVSCGIHLDDITKKEIELVTEAAEKVLGAFEKMLS